jgi:hypothetical protein
MSIKDGTIVQGTFSSSKSFSDTSGGFRIFQRNLKSKNGAVMSFLPSLTSANPVT